jgi:hypothetical protein
MTSLSALLTDLAAGRLTRRTFMQRAAAAGISAPLAAILARQPEAVRAFAPAAQQGSGAPGPAADTVTFVAFNVDQAPLNIQNGDMDL